MKIGIISDSHDHVPKIRSVVEWIHDEGIEFVLHAGDYVSPFALKELLKSNKEFVGVFGNNDGDRLLLNKISSGRIYPPPYELSLQDRHIMILHEPPGLEAMARCGLFDLVVYGHTHEPLFRREESTLVLNPGEVGGWLTGRSTVALYDTETQEAKIIEI